MKNVLNSYIQVIYIYVTLLLDERLVSDYQKILQLLQIQFSIVFVLQFPYLALSLSKQL